MAAVEGLWISKSSGGGCAVQVEIDPGSGFEDLGLDTQKAILENLLSNLFRAYCADRNERMFRRAHARPVEREEESRER
jgi:hypothetical protein